MKVGELREKLAKLKKEEITKLAVEFYKLIPKAKKEDYDVDSMINHPTKPKAKAASKVVLSLGEIEVSVNQFLEHARAQYYLSSNRVIPKKERPKWRFKVKKWYKGLIDTKRPDKDLVKQAEILSNLYELICESCGYQYFTAYDSFESIGISQIDFYQSVIGLLQEASGKLETVEKSINLIINNHLNRYTLYSSLMIELLKTFSTSDLKIKGIELTKEAIKKNNFVPKTKDKFGNIGYSTENYKKEEKNNNLAEFGYMLYASLYEVKEGVQFFNEHYHRRREEVKLYVLISILFREKQKQEIILEIEKAIENGITPRESLLNLLKEIKENGVLPQYMR